MEDNSLEKIEKILEFGKFGFHGTLWSGISGMILVLSLACLDAFTAFEINDWALVSIAGIVLLGVVSFGYFSLRKLPQITFSFEDGKIVASAAESRKDD
jgi:hypothetical protein